MDIENVKLILEKLGNIEDEDKRMEIIDMLNYRGLTAMHLATLLDNSIVLATLENHGADARILNDEGESVIEMLI